MQKHTIDNIPIYRAKKIDNGKWVEGFYYQVPPIDDGGVGHIICDFLNAISPNEIDPSTLSIHFPNMIDKNGKKIFASLGEDGVGGDILKLKDDFRQVVFWDTKSQSIYVEEYGNRLDDWEWNTFEVTEILKGKDMIVDDRHYTAKDKPTSQMIRNIIDRIE